MRVVQKLFQSTISDLSSISEIVAGAHSRISETDFAAETAALTRNQMI
jgi:flagellin